MNLRRAGRAAAVLAAVCGAGLASAAAAAASQPVAWGTTSSAPAGALGELFGVAAASSSDVLAVGGFNPGQPPTAVLTKPYAEHWTGAAWSATSVPLGQVYPSPSQAAQLNGVTVVDGDYPQLPEQGILAWRIASVNVKEVIIRNARIRKIADPGVVFRVRQRYPVPLVEKEHHRHRRNHRRCHQQPPVEPPLVPPAPF